MMDEMTPEQFVEWRAYSILEPFEDQRSSYYQASIMKTLWDIARDTKKHPAPFPLDQFLLKFGEGFAPVEKAPAARGPVGTAPTRNQSPEEKTRNLQIWAMSFAAR